MHQGAVCGTPARDAIWVDVPVWMRGAHLLINMQLLV